MLTDYKSLCEVIPGGVNSPVRAFKGMGISPLIVESGSEDLLHSVDGLTFIDYCCSWGALIHGHAHPQILKAVKARMDLGTSFGITTEIEEKIARKVVEHMESIEKIRFVSSGTEATMSAVRLARGYTERDLIVKFNGNYHGHADHFLVNAGSGVTTVTPTSSSKGIPNAMVRDVASLPYNDIETTRNFLQTHRVAAVILEPIAGNMGVVPAKQSFVEMLREETEKQGALLIFDEVITGYRVSIKGAQSLYGIKPDLTCLGKIIGGGFPVAAFGGASKVMELLAPEGPVYQAGTLSGNPVAMEGGYQAIRMLEEPGIYEELLRKTEMITRPVNDLILQRGLNVSIQQVGSMFTLFFGRKGVQSQEEAKTLDQKWFADFFRYLYKKGVYFPPSQFEACFVSLAHSDEHLRKTRDLILEYLS